MPPWGKLKYAARTLFLKKAGKLFHTMSNLIEEIRDITGPGGVLTGEDVSNRSDSWPPLGGCQAKAIVRPASTKEVSEVLRLCHAERQSVVTHGGVTGLVDGARAGPEDIVISLERLNGIETVDTVNRTVTVDAGTPLQKIHEAAENAGLLFPLDLGARGSATIGGNISTNAGGNSVIRYGMTREQLLGIEAVMADGTIISSMKNVIKNNTGYDLKQLFVGSEGTLGIVTRAVLRLRPLPRSRNTALVAVESFENLWKFLQAMDSALGGTLSAFEVMWNDFYRLIVGDGERHGKPLGGSHAYYVLIESTGGKQHDDAERFEGALQDAFEAGLAADAVIAQSKQQREDLWAIRDDIESMIKKMFPPVHFDVSLSIPDTEDYVREVKENLSERWTEARMVTFGHLGDGNIHLVITVGSHDPDQVLAVEEIVYGALGRRGGIISAEHGIGLQKRAYLRHSRSPEEIELMRNLKQALDPRNILNPGKILEA
jgi:FAD/FMN-containing dehydrogenase